MFEDIKDIIRYRELLRNLVIKDIKVRYKRSVLGFLWVMLNPLLMMLVLNIVFSELFRVATRNYTAYLISGIILWGFFSQSTSTSLVSFMGNSNLIKKIYLPKVIFPLSIVLSALIHFSFSLIPLFIILFITGTQLSPLLYLLPIILVLVFVFSFGISLILSTLTVFFHDTRYIYDVLLMAWMYMTPVFYPESIIPENFRFMLKMNPLYHYLTLFRSSLYADTQFDPQKLLYGFFFAALAFVAGWSFYNRYKDRVVFYL